MRLARHRQLDALIGEYMLGSLRGGARRRFERALREEPAVALRLRTLQQEFTPNYSERIAQTPPASGWQRLERELNLAQYRTPWYSRVSFLRVWAVGVTAALLLSLSLFTLRTTTEPTLTPIAQLAMKGAPPSVTAALSADRRTLQLRAVRPIVAGPLQSYELWVIPEGGAPISLAVLGQLDGTLRVPEGHVERLRKGALLAISVEPAGGFSYRCAHRPGDSFGRDFITKLGSAPCARVSNHCRYRSRRRCDGSACSPTRALNAIASSDSYELTTVVTAPASGGSSISTRHAAPSATPPTDGRWWCSFTAARGTTVIARSIASLVKRWRRAAS